ncbi:MAG: hypothetical protein PHE55_04900 [Methylococcaceae bacterium]|nr:hypothetical protein [Methylococcaceae bacterium]
MSIRRHVLIGGKSRTAVFLIFTGLASQASCESLRLQTANEIHGEATLSNNSSIGRPLPLAASWNTGTRDNGYDPDYQIDMIEQGHHLLPWFQFNKDAGGMDAKFAIGYYRKSLMKCSDLGLPISFISSQWENPLSNDKTYLGLPPALNPNVVKADGSIAPMVSPFGAIESWSQVGKQWTTSEVMKQLQFWYPNPPQVIFISNNEQPKLVWQDANTDQRYLTQYGSKTTDETKRQVIAQGWIDRYRALQSGMREGLTNATWKLNSIFVGYDAFGGSAFGRWAGWIDYSLYTQNRIEPWPLAWDGGTPSYYVNDWNSSTDYTLWSPQIEAMNWVFMLDEAYRLNPDFWFEISIWDGSQPQQASDKRAFYAKQGQTYTPERYAGMVKFGMWLLRPRVIREYRGWAETRAETEPYFLEIVRAVDNVYNNSVLKNFWRKGRLVPNQHHAHPYQENIPPEYSSKARWFLLDTSVDPKWPWNLQTEIPVFSLCLEIGTAPKREWLVYVHSPLGKREKVKITVPNYENIEVNVAPSGNYYFVREEDKTTKLVVLAG